MPQGLDGLAPTEQQKHILNLAFVAIKKQTVEEQHMKNTILTTLLLIALVITSNSQAQVGIGIMTADPSAQLDVTSTTKGFLPPRMTTTERDA